MGLLDWSGVGTGQIFLAANVTHFRLLSKKVDLINKVGYWVNAVQYLSIYCLWYNTRSETLYNARCPHATSTRANRFHVMMWKMSVFRAPKAATRARVEMRCEKQVLCKVKLLQGDSPTEIHQT